MIRSRFGKFAALAMLVLAVSGTGYAVAQVKPAAPALCVEGSCGTPPAAPTSGASGQQMKWHPGHYVRANCVGIDDAENNGCRAAAYQAIANNPHFKGGIINVTWGQIEPQKGVYNFAVIDKDLAILKGMGKRLIIELWTTQYGGSSPSTKYFPQWLINEGGAGNIQNSGCCTVQLQQAYWMDRMILLVQALGARYNSEPYIEQFQTNETTATPSGQYIRLIEPMAKAWPNTATILFANWVDDVQMARDLVAKANQFGVGIGGPDILPTGRQYGDDHGASVVRGRGVVTENGWTGDFGSTDYRGKIALSYQYQLIGTITPTESIAYAKVLGMNYIGWTLSESKNYDENVNEQLWPGVLAAVSASNGWVNTTCPSVYAGRCSSN